MDFSIHSERLDLVPLTPAFLRAVLAHDLEGAGRILGVPVPDGLHDLTPMMSLRLNQLEADPSLQPWLLRALVLRDRQVMIGHIGFHSAPSAEFIEPHVGFEFTVYPPFLRQGFAAEASKALMNWAHQEHGVATFVLAIRPDNLTSQALAAGLGFVRSGSYIDGIDGLTDILVFRVTKDGITGFAPLSRKLGHSGTP